MQTEKTRDLELLVTCPICHKEYGVMVNKEDFEKYKASNGQDYLKDDFPYLTASEREALITGICDDCWEKIFSDEEEE